MTRMTRVGPLILALPFMDDEPGLGVSGGGQAMLHGLNSQNATAANAVKAAMLATMFNLKLGVEILDKQGFPRSEMGRGVGWY